MLNKYCIWLPRKWCFVSNGQPGGWGVGMVVSRPSAGITVVDETPPPPAGHTGDGAGLIHVCLVAKWQNPSKKKKKIKRLGPKSLTPCFPAIGNFSTHGRKWQLHVSFGKSVFISFYCSPDRSERQFLPHKNSLNTKAGKQWGKSREQSDSRLTPCMRMSWEKETTVLEPMQTVEIAIVTQ